MTDQIETLSRGSTDGQKDICLHRTWAPSTSIGCSILYCFSTIHSPTSLDTSPLPNPRISNMNVEPALHRTPQAGDIRTPLPPSPDPTSLLHLHLPPSPPLTPRAMLPSLLPPPPKPFAAFDLSALSLDASLEGVPIDFIHDAMREIGERSPLLSIKDGHESTAILPCSRFSPSQVLLSSTPHRTPPPSHAPHTSFSSALPKTLPLTQPLYLSMASTLPSSALSSLASPLRPNLPRSSNSTFLHQRLGHCF